MMKPSNDRFLREQLVTLLGGGEAHATVEPTVRDFPSDLASARVGSLPHTPWRLLEHLRIAQWDILEFSRNPGHVSPDFPDGYWPNEDAPRDADAWNASVDAFCDDLRAMQRLVSDPASDLFAPIPGGDGQTLLREAMLVADHNAYHLGQMMAIRRAV
jgi:hypothetical protein